MRASKDGNLREVVIRDPETIFVIAKFARASRRSPSSAASAIILKALDRYRPKGDCIPPNQYWQQNSVADLAAADQIGAAGQEKEIGNGD